MSVDVAGTLYTTRTKCRLCPSENLELAVAMVPVPRGDGYVPYERRHEVEELFPLDIMLCLDCGNLQTSIDIDPGFIYEDYIWTTSCSPGLVSSYEKYVDDLITRFSPGGHGFAVEMGSNDGTFCRLLKNKGMKVLAVEPAKNLTSIIKANGVDVITDFFSLQRAKQIKQDYGPANLIIANHVFPNANDVYEIAQGAKELLHPEGIFSVQVFYLQDVLEKNLLENFEHEHTSYLYVRTLKQLFDRCGLELFDFEHVPTKGGSLRCFVQHAGGTRPISDKIDEYIKREESLGLHKAQTYNLVTKHIEEVRSKFRQFFDKCRAEGKTVAAYGTSVGATVFTYQYDIGKDLQFFVDDDPVRHNLVTPGYHIPVKSPEAIYTEKPDYVIAMAPLYADIIIGKHKRYLEQGGHFIKFRPEFEII
jgi:hypothetical protein